MAVRERLRMQQPDLGREGILHIVPKWQKCVSVLWDYVQNNYISVK